MRRARIVLLLLLSLALFSCDPAPSQKPAEVDLQDRLSSVHTVRDGGQLQLMVETSSGPVQVTPEEFARMVDRAHVSQRHHGWLFVLLNITSWFDMLWVGVGFLGQAMFTFRMVLQWLTSEKEKRSVVPVGFWWGSLIGGVLLLTYFIWRKDIVGVVGQSTGAFIYARNLILIYRHAKPAQVIATPAQDSAPSPAEDSEPS